MRRITGIEARCFAALVLAVVACAAQPAGAAVIMTTLDTLVPGGANAAGIDLGQQHYSGFSFSNAGPFALNPSDVTVRFSNGEGVQLLDNVQFMFGVDAAEGQAGFVSIGYRSDVRGNTPYARYGLRFNGAVPAEGPGAGDVTVSGTVRTVNGADITPGEPASDTATLFIHNDGPGRGEDDNREFLQLSLPFSLYVSKQITLTARESGPLNVSVIDNYQTIPEPAAAVLAVPATAFLLGRRRAAALASKRP